jgi:glucan 1,3-beta-glucosidase
MRFSTAIPLALAITAPIASVAAAGQIGFSLGDKKPDGTCKYQADYEADMDAMKSVTNVVRIYSATDCNCAQYLMPAAKAKGFQVILGVWYVPDIQFMY